MQVSSRAVEGFLASEHTLAERLGIALDHPLRLFDVAGLGLDFGALRRELLPSYQALSWDEYDAKRERVELLRERVAGADDRLDAFLPDYFAGRRQLDELSDLLAELDGEGRVALAAIRPARRRSVASFVARRSNGGWSIDREPDQAFAQPSDHDADYRRLERRFEPTPVAVSDGPGYRALLGRLAALVDEVSERSVASMRIVCHQMGLVARAAATATNAPEGIHQDGSDFIVSALVLERRGVVGGESVVYGPDKRTEYLRHTLQEGQGIFQADAGSPLWHWVTPVEPSEGRAVGVRNVLGYDIHI